MVSWYVAHVFSKWLWNGPNRAYYYCIITVLLLLLLTANGLIPVGSVLQCKTGQCNTVQYSTIQYNISEVFITYCKKTLLNILLHWMKFESSVIYIYVCVYIYICVCVCVVVVVVFERLQTSSSKIKWATKPLLQKQSVLYGRRKTIWVWIYICLG